MAKYKFIRNEPSARKKAPPNYFKEHQILENIKDGTVEKQLPAKMMKKAKWGDLIIKRFMKGGGK